MKPRLMDGNFFSVALLLSCLIASGCSKGMAKAKPLPTDVVVSQMQSSFAQADSNAKDVANDGITALKNNNYTEAVQKLQVLTQTPNLTLEQRRAANQAFANTLVQINQAAANGDAQAQAALKYYMMTK